MGVKDRTRVLQPLENHYRIDWKNSITRGLVFCAVPVGSTFIDLVTGVVGTRNGTVTRGIRPAMDGLSRRADGAAAVAGSVGTSDYVVWPISDTTRGGDVRTVGAIFALGGFTEQVDGRLYSVGGCAETFVAGDGFALGVDSFNQTGRGNIYYGKYVSAAKTSTNALTLGSSFANRTHFFGYSFNSSGASGNFFAGRTSEAYSSAPTVGTNTSRRACVLAQSTSDNAFGHNAYVSLMLMFNREVSLREYQSLYDNPWQFFVPRRRVIAGIAVAATGGPFPFFTRGRQAGGFTDMSGGIT